MFFIISVAFVFALGCKLPENNTVEKAVDATTAQQVKQKDGTSITFDILVVEQTLAEGEFTQSVKKQGKKVAGDTRTIVYSSSDDLIATVDAKEK